MERKHKIKQQKNANYQLIENITYGSFLLSEKKKR